MNIKHTDVELLVESILRVLPRLREDGRELAVAIYRRLSLGRPVAHEELAEDLGRAQKRVDAAIEDWTGVLHDDKHKIVGFWGLSIPETRHRLVVGGRILHAWCAWDTLFLPGILQATAEVESSCPVTGRTVRLSVSPRGIESLEPVGAALSMMRPVARKTRENLIENFCCHIRFFVSREAGERWTNERPGTSVMAPADGFRIGRSVNRARYGKALSQIKIKGGGVS